MKELPLIVNMLVKNRPIAYGEICSALSNTFDGTILLGVEEVSSEKGWRKRYLIVGVTDAEKLRVDL